MSVADEIVRLQGAKADIKSAIEAKGVTVPSSATLDDYDDYIAQISGGGPTVDFNDWRFDGDTHLWIELKDERQKSQALRIRMIGTIDWGDGTAKDTANVTAYTTFTHTYSELGRYRIDLHPTSGTFYLGGAATGYNVMGGRSNSTYYRYSAMYQAEVGTSIITAISNYAFYYCIGMHRLYIPKTITSFGQHACYNCYGLREVIFEDPSTITAATLSNNFYYCHALQKMTPWAFKSGGTTMTASIRNSYSITEFTIPSFVTNLAANTFTNMYGLAHLWCLPTSAPVAADSTVFTSFPTGCVIHVPYGSLSSYQGASQWSSLSSQMAEAGTVTYTLTNCTRSNVTPMVAAGSSFTTTLTPTSSSAGAYVTNVEVKMGGTDITSTAYSDGVVTIANVTGNITIKAEEAE